MLTRVDRSKVERAQLGRARGQGRYNADQGGVGEPVIIFVDWYPVRGLSY